MSKNKTLLISVSLVAFLSFLELVTLVALLTAACGASAPRQGGAFLYTACGVLAPSQEPVSSQRIQAPDSWLTMREAEALVRQNVVTSFDPSVILFTRAITGTYSSRYEGDGKWNVSTPLGEWVLLERQGIAFPLTTTVTRVMASRTADRALSNIERAMSSIESDISSMESDISSPFGGIKSDIDAIRRGISSMESDISSMESGISSMQWGISSMEWGISSMESNISEINRYGVRSRR